MESIHIQDNLLMGKCKAMGSRMCTFNRALERLNKYTRDNLKIVKETVKGRFKIYLISINMMESG